MRASDDQPLVWVSGAIKTPPFGAAARVEAGALLRRLQAGELIGMPHARPMPSIGRRCLELRVVDRHLTWRVILRCDEDAVVILAVFAKKDRQTPKAVIANCKRRLLDYDTIAGT
jgi:phage-related protein